jgi:hypothetical protein
VRRRGKERKGEGRRNDRDAIKYFMRFPFQALLGLLRSVEFSTKATCAAPPSRAAVTPRTLSLSRWTRLTLAFRLQKDCTALSYFNNQSSLHLQRTLHVRSSGCCLDELLHCSPPWFLVYGALCFYSLSCAVRCVPCTDDCQSTARTRHIRLLRPGQRGFSDN